MSTVYLVPDDPAFDAVGFDVTEAENHVEASTLTANAVEDGSVINDHLIHTPDAFSCTVVVSQSPSNTTFYGDGADSSAIPIDTYTPARANQLAPTTVQKGLLTAAGFQVTRIANLIQEMQERLTRIRLAGVTMTVITATREYNSMILTNIALPRGPKSTGLGRFSLEFHLLKIVQTQSVNAPQPKEPRGKPAGAKGPAAGESKPVTEDISDPKKRASWLLQLGQGAGLL